MNLNERNTEEEVGKRERREEKRKRKKEGKKENSFFVAAFEGDEQIIQILLEKGANVDLATEVVLLIVSFSFLFSLSHFSIFF